MRQTRGHPRRVCCSSLVEYEEVIPLGFLCAFVSGDAENVSNVSVLRFEEQQRYISQERDVSPSLKG